MIGDVSGRGRKYALGLATAAFTMAATALLNPASATLSLELASGASDVLLTDTAASGGIGTPASVVTGWNGFVTASEDLGSDELDSSGSTLKGAVGSTITIATTETFTVSGHSFEVLFGFGGSNSGSISPISDALYLNGNLIDTLAGTGNFSTSYLTADFAPGVYTIEELVTLTQETNNPLKIASQTFSSSADLLIPEPLTLWVFGAGLFCIGLLRRRKRG